MLIRTGVSHLNPHTIMLKLGFICSGIFYTYEKTKLGNEFKSCWQDQQHSHISFPEERNQALFKPYTHTFCKSDLLRYLEKQRKWFQNSELPCPLVSFWEFAVYVWLALTVTLYPSLENVLSIVILIATNHSRVFVRLLLTAVSWSKF